MHYSILALAATVGIAHAQGSSSFTSAYTSLITPSPTSCASSVTGTIAQPSGQSQITACPSSVPLGEACGADAQCKNGASCYASNSGLIRRCGNLNAACSQNDQCAFNACVNGACSGPQSSATTSGVSTAPSASPSCAPLGSRDSQGRYSCNPAHQYPSGNYCVIVDGCPVLVTGSSTAPTGQASCVPAGQTDQFGRYSCNPAHEYPTGQLCRQVNGCYVLIVIDTAPSVASTAAGADATAIDNNNGTLPTAHTSSVTLYPSPTPKSGGEGGNGGSSGSGGSGGSTPYTGSAGVTSALSGVFALVAGIVAFML